MKMLAQNPDGDTITAQEFATARQDLTNLLQNTGGYVPEQVATINERVRVSEADAAQLQRQRQRERIARQQRFAQAPNLTGVLSAAPDPGLGSVAFGLGSGMRSTASLGTLTWSMIHLAGAHAGFRGVGLSVMQNSAKLAQIVIHADSGALRLGWSRNISVRPRTRFNRQSYK